MAWDSLIEAARQGSGPLKHARRIRRFFRGLRLPVIRPVIGAVYAVAQATRLMFLFLVKFFIREPYLRYRCARVGRRVVLQGEVPQILGDGRIEVGDDVLIGGSCTWDLAYSVAGVPELIIGDRVGLNYRNAISVAKSVRIGDDTMIASNVRIFDNISHPISPARRLAHDRINASESEPVVIGRNCWIGMNSIILKGVTIGDNSIVAAGSIVTKSVPANTIVAGNPAVPVRTIPNDIPENSTEATTRASDLESQAAAPIQGSA